MTRYVVMCTIPVDNGYDTSCEEYSGEYYFTKEDAQDELEEAQEHPAVLNAWIKEVD